MDKYIVSQEFMNKLEEWRYVEGFLICASEISILPDVVENWWFNGNNKENNSRLIAIIRWVNGEDVFEVEKPKKWVVRSKDVNDVRDCLYVHLSQARTIDNIARYFTTNPNSATKFDTKEEAESWANSHQEVIEVK